MNVLSIVLVILFFGLLIAIHEFGHFIAAKTLGVKVNEFAIGMGPKLLHKEKGETLYTLRAFPIGGFCAMEGEGESSDDPRAFSNKAWWKKLIILVAGAFMNRSGSGFPPWRRTSGRPDRPAARRPDLFH